MRGGPALLDPLPGMGVPESHLGETVRDVEPLVNVCHPGSLLFWGAWQIPHTPSLDTLQMGIAR